MTIDTAGRERLAEAFERLTAAPLQDRGTVMDAVCGGDAALRTELEELLAAYDRAGDFCARPACDLLGEAAVPLPPGTRVGGYRVVREISAGGSGTVFEAEQSSPHRRVALKVMRAGVGSESAARRFRDEAEILARLEHPAIAHVYEAGIHRSDSCVFPWIAMEFVAGARTLVEFAQTGRMPARERLVLFETAARAVHHGHQKGVVHRDVKPANVLVDEAGNVKVIDFGIARAEGMEGAPRLAGTLPYMAPEQCAPAPAEADVRSDVHALGVLLFELLTDRLPFDVEALPLAQALRTVREVVPPAPSRTDPSLAGDIDAIVAKALAKDPDRRYASAAALADDVRRHLQDEPVEAVPPTLLYQLRKFARRRRAFVAAAAAVLVVSVGAAAVSGWFAIRAVREQRTAETQSCAANLAAASAALRANDVADAAQRLERVPERLRTWEWRHLHDRLDRSDRTLADVGMPIVWGAASGGGTRCAATCQRPRMSWLALFGSAPGTEVRTLPLRLEDGRPNAVAVSPDGARVVVGYDSGAVELRDAASGGPVHRELTHRDRVVTAVFDRLGRRVATSSCDGTVKVSDAATGDVLRTLPANSDRVVGLAFSPDGARLALGGRDGSVTVWDVGGSTPNLSVVPHTASVEAVSFSPDGRRLATVSRDLQVLLLDSTTGATLAAGRGHTRNVRDVEFSPDGRFVVTASYDRTLRVWSADGLQPLACLRGHRRPVYSVDFVDDAHFVSFGMDGSARLWSVTAGDGVVTLPGLTTETQCFAVSPDGSLAAGADQSGTMIVWDIDRRTEIGRRSLASRACPLALTFGQGSSRVVTVERDGSTIAWSTPGLAPTALVGSAEPAVTAVADASRVVVAFRDGLMESRDPSTGRVVGSWHAPGVTVVATAGAGCVASSGSDGILSVWREGETAAEVAARPHAGSAHALAADSRHVAASWDDGTILLLDRRTLHPVAALEGHLGWVPDIAFSPDGSRVATCGHDETVRLWDTSTGDQVLVLDGPLQPVWHVAWSLDGASLASSEGAAELPGTIRVWRAGTAGPR